MSSLFDYYELIERSGLFDAGFYLRANPEVAKANLDPLTHYLEIGAHEGRNPSRSFDAAFYMRECSRRGLSAENPLVHFIREGSAKGLPTSPPNGRAAQKRNPSIDITRYRADGVAGLEGVDDRALSEISHLFRSSFIDDALTQRILGDGKQSRATAEMYLRLPIAARPGLSVAFDRAYYLMLHPDLANVALDPLLHFLSRGCVEGRSPHPLVDPAYIRQQDSALLPQGSGPEVLWEILQYDLADPSPYFRLQEYRAQLTNEQTPTSGMLLHFLTVGCRLGLRPNRYFDAAWYSGRLSAAQDPLAAIRHFVLTGDRAGLSPSAEFSGQRYLQRYQDVATAALPPLLHYLTAGEFEARPIFAEAPTVRRTTRTVALGWEPAVSEPNGEVSKYFRMKERLESARQSLKDSLEVQVPEIVRIEPGVLPAKRVRLRKHKAPKVSVLIPAYNEPTYTAECLLSLSGAGIRTPFEVILADDASTDPAMGVFAEVPNLIHLRQPTNVGFLENCNRAFIHCRGDYVLLLNNDAQLMPGALDALVSFLDDEPDCGAVGPRILYPNGRLQEAGCAIDQRGVSTMIGLFADPELRQYSYARDVHYCSGAALMVRRSDLDGELFDRAFAPAYCEDADLCLRLIAKGRHVRYCPSATVVHHLSVSTNKQSVQRRLQLVAENQQKLATKWQVLLDKISQARVICFYLPQFHTTPENDFNWGQGFTEWTNVTRARPAYRGHYQPHLPSDLGFYDLRVKESVQRQAALARRYGISGFCVYYYNFGRQRALYEAFEAIVADPSIDFPFMVCWANENWTRHWDGGTRQVIFEQLYDTDSLQEIVQDAVRFARDPRYLTVDGCPLFAVYRPMLLPDLPGFVRLCRERFREAGFPGVHLTFVDGMETAAKAIAPKAIGFDACIEFPPHGHAVELAEPPDALEADFAGRLYDYDATVLQCSVRRPALEGRYPGVFPGWDNTPRQPRKGDSFPNNSPEAFQVYLEEKLDELHRTFTGERRMLFVNAWNEWAEGAHMEPDQRFGHRWLEAIRNALQSKYLL